MDPEQPPRRRRGLPRTTEEQQPAAEPALNSEAADQPEPEDPPADQPAGQQSDQPADQQSDQPADQQDRRTGLNEQPRRQGMHAKPARRTGMAQRSSQPQPEQHGQQGQHSDQPARRAPMGEQPRRTGMAEQPTQPTQQPARRAPMGGQGEQPAQQKLQQTPQPAPAEAQSGAARRTAPEPSKAQPSKAQPSKAQQAKTQRSKTRPPQKTFLNRTGRQWAVQGGIGVAAIIVLAAVAVLLTRWLLGTEAAADFLRRYPGQYAQPDAPGGYPPWLNWAHFFNAFLMVLIIKTGIQIRTESRPAAYWTPKWNKKRKISLTIWLHNALDLLWVLNGAAFVVLLIITGYWQRVVPTSWEVFPNALSAGVQYVSLDWPTVGEWAHYNSLQELAYFTTIFIAAPLAILTGLRMSGLWPGHKPTLNKLFPVELARAVHFPVMIYFTVFILVHLILVFATDALANLNQIYTGDDAQNWTGFWLFTLSLGVIVAGAFLARALFVAPIASLFGRVGR